MANLLRRLFARHRTFLLACAVLLGLFQFLLCVIVASMNLQAALDQMLAFAPPIMRNVIEQALFGGSVSGILAFGWNHPITHAITTAVAITLGARAVAGEVESGAIELVLAQPIARARYLAAHVVFGLGAILLVSGFGVLGTTIGQAVYSLHAFSGLRLLQLLFNLFLLQAGFYAITLLISTTGREAGRVAAAGVLIAVVSFFIDVIGQFWTKAEFLRPVSLHKYFDPPDILVKGELADASLLVLSVIATVFITLSFWRLQTRDLP